jgi:MYXO-CTERM domain-containing protein
VLVASVAAPGVGPRMAQACGGLFCGGPPPDPFAPLPVAQSGENIVFAIDKPGTGETTVTAYIQILYSGTAADFSWVLPIDAVPTITVGTDRVFTQVAQLTRPTYGATTVVEGECKTDPNFGDRTPTSVGGTGAGGFSGTVDGSAGVNVVFRGDVGPFDAVVLHSTSSAELLAWLAANAFVVSDTARSIIDEYVALNKYFVAVKLLSGQETGAIQPVVLKFAGEVPCVPLKLTAIAALADMPVNLYVLGAHRAVPSNYFEITLNQAKIDWLGGGRNYTAMVTAAANEAGGNAFIAEYAGTARVMDAALWPNNVINLPALRAATTPPVFLQLVLQQGLLSYGPMLPLLRKYIPQPQELIDAGISESQFYNNNAIYWSQIPASFAPFDPVAITAEIQTKIVDPLQAGQTLFDTHGYLTRLATFISPEEMTKDPEFVFNPDLPTLSNVHTATAHIMCGMRAFTYCEAPIRLDLPDGGVLWYTRTNCGADLTPFSSLPSLASATLQAEAGAGQTVMDNRAKINQAVSAHNESIQGGGCGCSVAPGASGGVLVLLLALAFVRRRRRKQRDFSAGP